jgi:catechol 2,3-dioxygenase-like lactoylglutathione lyase family enzyme
MPVTGFSHYNLRASRDVLDRLRDFYIEVVGMRLGDRPQFASFGYWLYIGSQPVLHLSEASPGEARTPHLVNTFDHVALESEDIDGFEMHLRRLGIPYETADVPLTGIRQLFFEDPAGNGVELNFAVK